MVVLVASIKFDHGFGRFRTFLTKLISNVMYAPINKFFNTASATYLGFATKAFK